jgi:hypothetical protein
MNLIKNTAQQLVRRRLWPVALLLVAALVAVPMTLAKSPAPAAPAPQAAVAAHASDAAANTPIVELATPDASSHARRRVLGQAKDPFAPAPLPKAKKSKKQAEATPTPAATTDAGSGSDSGGGATAPTGTAPPSATPDPTFTMPKSSVKVRFGVADETAKELPTSFVRRLEPLVASDVPVLVFERLTSGGSAAIFSIPGDVTAVGDGSCEPSPQDCETLKLHAGQTEFITVKGAGETGGDLQYELDLVKIFAKATKVPKSELDPSAAGAGS